jgi:formylglycine-generating enzyme
MKKLLFLFLAACNSNQLIYHEEITKDIYSDIIINNPVAENKTSCSNDMIEIEGDFCFNLEEICLKWGDPDNKGANGPVQCLEFKYPTRCLSGIKHIHYCIDKFPLPNIEGELPITNMSWYDAKSVCESKGKRLCERKEFTQACRGNENKPYPYGNGYVRDCNVCNCDRTPWLDPNTHTFAELDKRVPLGSKPNCKSDYGVYDMVGNNDRWVENESGKPYKSALMGGHAVKGARNRCTPATIIHNESFRYYETGGLCCKNVME